MKMKLGVSDVTVSDRAVTLVKATGWCAVWIAGAVLAICIFGYTVSGNGF
jgi:hypothetical protein